MKIKKLISVLGIVSAFVCFGSVNAFAAQEVNPDGSFSGWYLNGSTTMTQGAANASDSFGSMLQNITYANAKNAQTLLTGLQQIDAHFTGSVSGRIDTSNTHLNNIYGRIYALVDPNYGLSVMNGHLTNIDTDLDTVNSRLNTIINNMGGSGSGSDYSTVLDSIEDDTYSMNQRLYAINNSVLSIADIITYQDTIASALDNLPQDILSGVSGALDDYDGNDYSNALIDVNGSLDYIQSHTQTSANNSTSILTALNTLNSSSGYLSYLPDINNKLSYQANTVGDYLHNQNDYLYQINNKISSSSADYSDIIGSIDNNTSAVTSSISSLVSANNANTNNIISAINNLSFGGLDNVTIDSFDDSRVLDSLSSINDSINNLDRVQASYFGDLFSNLDDISNSLDALNGDSKLLALGDVAHKSSALMPDNNTSPLDFFDFLDFEDDNNVTWSFFSQECKDSLRSVS